jgi:hypothetical protein
MSIILQIEWVWLICRAWRHVFVVGRCIAERLRENCFAFPVKRFVQNVVILMEMCQ